MTTNHHTPILSSPHQPANASTINAPLAELDTAITNHETRIGDLEENLPEPSGNPTEYLDGEGNYTVPVGTGASVDGHIIKDEGVALPQRASIDFVGAGVTVTNEAGGTQVSIPGATATGVQSVVAGTGISVDNADPENPVINLTVANYVDSRRLYPIFMADFYGSNASDTSNAPFANVVAMSSGSNIRIADEVNHPGIHQHRSHASNTNSGMVRSLDAGTLGMWVQGGWECQVIFRLPTLTDTLHRVGWHDSIAVATDPTDGLYIDITAGVAKGRARTNNNTFIDTATTYSLSANTWYRQTININDDGTVATFSIYADDGTLLWSDTITSNIPIGSSYILNFSIQTGKTTAGTANLYDLDWACMFVNKALIR